MNGLLFITASLASTKDINRLLLHLHDWEYGAGDCFSVIRSRKLADLQELARQEKEEKSYQATTAPISSDFETAWRGSDLSAIEDFVNQSSRLTNDHFGSLFLVLDDEGLKTTTVVVCEKVYIDPDESPTGSSDPDQREGSYNKVRMPWEDAYICWCNLNIANMGFEDFCIEEEEPKDGWWTYQTPDEPTTSPENLRERDEKLERFEKDGLV